MLTQIAFLIAGVCYPLLVLSVIVATANHYWLDAVVAMCTTTISSSAILALCLTLPACGSLQNATNPVQPLPHETPAIGEVPDAILLDVIRHSELIVLAVPQDLVPADGFTPNFQLGAKETWYNVRLTVDTVVKGRLGQAKVPD